MNEELEKIATLVQDRLKRYKLQGRTVTLKIKYHDFKQVTRSQSFETGFDDIELILTTARTLLAGTEPEDKKIRLLGISMSNFNNQPISSFRQDEDDQLRLF